MTFKLLSFFPLFLYVQSHLQTVAIRGQILCTVDGGRYHDSDLRVSIVDHDYFSRDDVMAEGFFPNGTVSLTGTLDEYFKIQPKIWIDHQCGMGRKQQDCFTRTEFFIGADVINKIYDFGNLFLDKGEKPYRNNKIKCEGRRKNPKNSQKLLQRFMNDLYLHQDQQIEKPERIQ